MKNLARLIDAICEAFAQGLPGQPWSPKGGVTFCNEAVNYVCIKMGYEKLKGLLANQIFDLLQTNGDWIDISARDAQFDANQGVLVLASWKNPDILGHGHVCVVRPGEVYESASWNGEVPKVMNIGEENFIDKAASYAFSRDRMPKFFALKEML